MKSFVQYILEVATEVQKNPRFHYGSNTDRDGNASSHHYDFRDHDQFVQIDHSHAENDPRSGVQDKHHSHVSFSVDGEDHRTGRQKSIADPTGVRGASAKFRNVGTSLDHHIDKVVNPNLERHGEHFISYHADREPSTLPDSKSIATKERTYKKMAERIKKRHGYEDYKTVKDHKGVPVRKIFVKRYGKKK